MPWQAAGERGGERWRVSLERDGRPVGWFGLPADRGFRSLADDERGQVIVALLLGRPLPRHLASGAPAGNVRFPTRMVYVSLGFGLMMLGFAIGFAGTTSWWGQAAEWDAAVCSFAMAAVWVSVVSRARRGLGGRRPLRRL